jgi:hypothetical protein
MENSCAENIVTLAKNGHFYSPIVDPADISSRETEIWPNNPQTCGIDYNDVAHKHILVNLFSRYIADYDYPEKLEISENLTEFHTQNPAFSWLDARALFVLLRAWQPSRLIEIGSGFSTLLSADVNRRFFDGQMQITCIEPYPRPFLKNGIPGVSRLLEEKVQNVPFTEFERLQAGDILFIDSSHVAKTGSDVNFLYFEVLPRLRSGVNIHIHDIFLPHDYPRKWVITENRSWNEQYLLRALLMYSQAFKVEFGCNYAFWRYPDLVRKALKLENGAAFGGGSFWIQRC